MSVVSVVQYGETTGNITLSLRKSTLKYVDEFVMLKCALDMLEQKLFPNGKEITESMGAFNCFRKHIGYRDDFLYSNKGGIFVIGDGHTPRTAALFAYRTPYNVWAIDPALRLNTYRVERLITIPKKIEDVAIIGEGFDKIVIVCVHSHAKLTDCIKKLSFKHAFIISIPCCVPDDAEKEVGAKLVRSYEDWGIHSEKRVINLYECIKL